MKTLKLTKGDLINFEIIENKAAIEQTILNYAKTLKGEMQLQTQNGIRFFDTILSSRFLPDIFEQDFRKRIKEISDVLEISNFTYDMIDNDFSYTVTIKTTFGELTLNDNL